MQLGKKTKSRIFNDAVTILKSIPLKFKFYFYVQRNQYEAYNQRECMKKRTLRQLWFKWTLLRTSSASWRIRSIQQEIQSWLHGHQELHTLPQLAVEKVHSTESKWYWQNLHINNTGNANSQHRTKRATEHQFFVFSQGEALLMCRCVETRQDEHKMSLNASSRTKKLVYIRGQAQSLYTQ